MIFSPRKSRKEEEAFEEEALEHMSSLYSAALRFTRHERDAEDLVQDTMLKAFRFFHRYERNTNIKAWLFKILYNIFVNKYRQKNRERSVFMEMEQEANLKKVYSQEILRQSREPEAEFFSQMLSDEVKHALDTLPGEFRMVVVLADLQGFSYKEIANIMECPIGTVMSRLYRGRRMLQEVLYDYAVQEGIIKPTQEASPDGNTVSLEEYRSRIKN